MTPTFTPEQFISEVEDVLPNSTPAEKKRLCQHARAWADVNYPEQLPAELESKLKRMEAR